ncbi:MULTISPECIES: GtrA family protein [Acidianus]|uniref:GtrA-like protein domain-containing protein n=1 Tax=Candidatus Acidianus copahuensis TaxID=1160895 RepID=A0A031LMI8_9CREN|nr:MULTISPECIES: GtrA family protein [Acidianus]EZQ02118.1 hypothetical protein CM19_11105 [Candidatus Acidianus copahuensis]NON61522.1 hypothetical protein [Acidianus sp. RZ1]
MNGSTKTEYDLTIVTLISNEKFKEISNILRQMFSTISLEIITPDEELLSNEDNFEFRSIEYIRNSIEKSESNYVIVLAGIPENIDVIKKIYDALYNGNDIVIASREFSRDNKILKLAIYLISPEVRRTSDPFSGVFGLNKAKVNYAIGQGYNFLFHLLNLNPKAKVEDVPVGKIYSEFKFNVRRFSKELLKNSSGIEFFLIGISGTAINLLALYLMLRLRFIFEFSSSIAIIIGMIWTYTLLYEVIVKRVETLFIYGLIKYLISSAITGIAQYSLASSLYFFIHVSGVTSQFLAIIISSYIGYEVFIRLLGISYTK